MITILRGRHVYVVLEFPGITDSDPVIHGVFARRDHAEAKAMKLKTRHYRTGHIAILKQKVRGAL